MSAAPPDLSKRAWLARAAGLGVAIGATTLAAGCLDAETAAPEDLADDELALTGSTVGWADAIGTAASPLDLRTLTAGSYGIVIARGFHAAGDGGGGRFHWTTDTTTPDDGGRVIVPAAGPRTGCWKRLDGGPVDVRWYGARGNGAGNDQPAIQLAINAVAAAGGGVVYVPPGRYRTTAPIALAASSVVLRGAGNASIIAPVGSFDTIVVQSATAGTYVYDARIDDLLLDEAGKTGGRAVYGNHVANFVSERLYGSAGWNGIAFDTFNNVTLNHPRFISYRGGAGTAYLRLTGGAGGNDAIRSDVARVEQAVFGGDLVLGMKGVDIDGFVHTVNLFNVHFVNIGAEALHTRNNIGANNVPTFITADDLECDFPQLECLRFDAGVSFTFTGALLNGSRSRANVYVGSACRSATFTGGFSSGAQQSGIAIAGRDVCVSAMHFKFNSSDGFPGGTRNSYPGILIGGTSRGVSVTGCRSGELATSSFQRHGCQIDVGADEFCVTGNVFTNNASGGILNCAGTSASKLVANNIG
jgi:hypothetical protein